VSSRYVERITCTGVLPEDSYLNKLPVVEYLLKGNSINFDKDVTFFIGENGAGKSTIIEALLTSWSYLILESRRLSMKTQTFICCTSISSIPRRE
jgi:predicted ATPase